ncbi:tetratricopeptide repeat protein [Lipingzhangella rawalii]
MSAGSAMSGASPSGRVSTRTGSSARGALGAGLVYVPPVPYKDPSEAIMQDPVVPEKNRSCGSCGAAVGQSRNGRPGRTEGFCSKCGTPYSFTPKLQPGELVNDQYEVLGCLAHGGLGWIYLAKDRKVSDRWVVLKGLLNTGDAEAHQAAAAERAFLAEVDHPNIVKIWSVAEHPDPASGIPIAYIVMEYVGGRSLKQLLVERRESGTGDETLPVEQVLAYSLEVLRALGYLHSRDLLFCDFKPDNVIQSEEQVKLIDLGGVRHLDDQTSAVYATPGYRVPEEELTNTGPTISADLYTVGRSMAVLSFNFSWTRRYQHEIPPRETVPLLVRYESYDRLLRRATARDPQQRFHAADEMAEQVTGVLREILALGDGEPRPSSSTLFSAEHFSAGTGGILDNPDEILHTPSAEAFAAALPVPLADAEDPAARMLTGLAGLGTEQLVVSLRSAHQHTPETRLMLARALIQLGRGQEAVECLDEAAVHEPHDWRVSWYRALVPLRMGEYADARNRFDAMYSFLPGEVAPKLALATACEGAGELGRASRYYWLVWNTDRSYVSAAFGLARCLLAQGDRIGAVGVLNTVPELSSLHIAAQQAAISALVGTRGDASVTKQMLLAAGEKLDYLNLGGQAGGQLAARVLHAALDWVQATGKPDRTATLAGAPLTERGLRTHLEWTYRELARYTNTESDRHLLVDAANDIRPRTWV